MNNPQSIYPNPSSQSPVNDIDESMNKNPKKGKGLKIFLLIFAIIVIFGIIGYFIFKNLNNKNESTATQVQTPSPKPKVVLEGKREKISVVIPTNYIAEDYKGYKIIYDPKIISKKDDMVFGAFTLMFIRDNSSNDVNAEVARIKDFLEKLKQKTGSQNTITLTQINNITTYKSEGMGTEPAENYSFTDYYLITAKSVFIVGRGAEGNNLNFSQKEFDEILNSIQISPK